MDTRLWVDGFPSCFTDDELRALFSRHGTVLSATIVKDARGQSLEFGYVEMSTPHEACSAIRQLHRTYFYGSVLLVSLNKRGTGSR